MGFLGIYKAVYSYLPQAEGELSIKEGDVLLVLEKSSEDDWWTAKKKAASDEEEEPEGLIPNNYIEEASPINTAKALYDYTRQTDEEISFIEDARLKVYDTSDPDWTLVGNNGDFGFAPSNYIEIISNVAPAANVSEDEEEKPPMPQRPTVVIAQEDSEPEYKSAPESPLSASAAQSPAIALAGIIHGKGTPASPVTTRSLASPPPDIKLPPRAPQSARKASTEDLPLSPAPPLPGRSLAQTTSNTGRLSPSSPNSQGILPSPPYNRSLSPGEREDRLGGYHLYNVYEIVSYFGKNKKLPLTLGINIGKGKITTSPESSKNGSQMEWTAERLTNYSIEGKHVFLELVRPSKSYDLHAGAKDTAEEIVSALGELAGAARAEGLREVIAAGTGISGQKKGCILYDFMAQGDDEVTVAEGDDVIVVDDTKSEEWWMVRRLRNNTVGVVPSSYIDITGIVTPPLSPQEANTAQSFVRQNRLEEEALARKNEASSRQRREGGERGQEVGPGLQLPNRHSSLNQNDNDKKRTSQKPKRNERERKSSASASKPDPNETRTWTDRSGSFKVEAQFIGLREGKIHLHKWNGVKIAVPVQKMSVEDLEYVEVVTGLSLDDEKPLAEVRKRASHRPRDRNRNNASSSAKAKAGIAIEQPKKREYDWFDFFLSCGVNPQVCERYASAFAKDAMGEEVLPDVDTNLLRTLGLKEGDILRVMKTLDNKFGRSQSKEKRNVSFAVEGEIDDGKNVAGGLFSGPGGALRNNTRKGRPASAAQNSDIIDSKLLEQGANGDTRPALPEKQNTTKRTEGTTTNGFEDDAWEPRPSRESATSQQAPPLKPHVTGSLADLSLLSPPLQPTPALQVTQSSSSSNTQTAPLSPQSTQQVGASSTLFDQVAKTTSLQPQLAQQQQAAATRARPQAPHTQNQNSLLSPPPQRSSSAPQNPQQPSAFAAPVLQPQLTGFQNGPNVQAQVAPSGQSLQELQQQRLQPQHTFTPQNANMQQPPNGILPQATGYAQYVPQPQVQNPNFASIQPQQQQQPQFTGYAPQFLHQQQQQPQFVNGQQQAGSPFADPSRAPFQPQPMGFQQSSTFSTGTAGLLPQQTGINSFLPPALQPERTGVNGNGNGFGVGHGPPPAVPTIPQQQQQQFLTPAAAPLLPQKTGPAPSVRFGVTGGSAGANKLQAQPTGRRANLSQATPDNPFGF